MKKIIIPLLVILGMATACKKNNDSITNNPPQLHLTVQWDKKYSYWLNEPSNIHNLVATADGGAAVFFSWFTDAACGTCLLKTDGNGVTEFQHEFTSSEFGCGDASLLQTADNGFIVYGNNTYPVFGKIDISGNILWTKQANYHQLSHLNCMIEKPTGGYLALATGYGSIFLLDLNVAGDTNRCFQVADSLEIPEAVQLEYNHAGEIVLTYSGRINGDYMSVVKAVDTNFNQIWSLPFAQSGHGLIQKSFYINTDNSIMVAGRIWTNGMGDDQGYIASVSPTGSLIWSHQIAAMQDAALDIVLAPSGGYYVVGEHDIGITKINSNGDVLWRESLEPTNQLGPSGNTLKVSGNAIYFFGSVFDFPAVEESPVLIKFSE